MSLEVQPAKIVGCSNRMGRRGGPSDDDLGTKLQGDGGEISALLARSRGGDRTGEASLVLLQRGGGRSKIKCAAASLQPDYFARFAEIDRSLLKMDSLDPMFCWPKYFFTHSFWRSLLTDCYRRVLLSGVCVCVWCVCVGGVI